MEKPEENQTQSGSGLESSACSVVLIGGRNAGKRIKIPAGERRIQIRIEESHPNEPNYPVNSEFYERRTFWCQTGEVDVFASATMTDLDVMRELLRFYRQNGAGHLSPTKE